MQSAMDECQIPNTMRAVLEEELKFFKTNKGNECKTSVAYKDYYAANTNLTLPGIMLFIKQNGIIVS